MKILIVGTGGVGGYFGGRLALTGHDVTFLARGTHLKALKSNGLKVLSINGDFTVPKVKVTDNIENLEKQDLIILALKTFQVKSVAPKLNNLLSESTVVLTTQNGVVMRDELSEYLPVHHIIEGACQIISKVESPGIIRHFAIEPKITIGERNGTRSDRLIDIQNIGSKAGFNVVISDNIQVELWNKFILICVGGLIAVSQTTYGGIRSNPESRQLMIEVLSEGYLLAQAAGIPVSSSIIQHWIEFIDGFPYEATSSLCRDIWNGHPSEIDYKNGSLVQLAQKYGVSTPINRYIYYTILPMERVARQSSLKV